MIEKKNQTAECQAELVEALLISCTIAHQSFDKLRMTRRVVVLGK